MEGYRCFRKDKKGRQRGGITLYCNEQLKCMELCLGKGKELTEILSVRIKGRAETGDIVVRACY